MAERLGDYELEEPIGRGGMAEVYRAVAVKGQHVGRLVAIKKLLPELAGDPIFVDAFVSEADVSRSLRHPAIVSVLETGIHGDSYFIAMDYIEGRDLAQVIKAARERSVRMPIDLCCHIVHVVALALDYAHRLRSKKGDPLGLVHCDVTPSNIFIGANGRVWLGDFGVAHSRLMSTSLGDKGIAGKAAYLAPEQIMQERLSPATDVFALGSVLFELLCGRRAFEGKTNKEVLKRVLVGDVPRVRTVRDDVPEQVEAVVAKALVVERPSKEPPSLSQRVRRATRPNLTRYGTAAHLAIDLENSYPHHQVSDARLAELLRGLFAP